MAARNLSDGNSEGTVLGQSSTDKIGFYGSTPAVRPATLTAITDASGGTGAYTNGMLTITATYNQAIIANNLATLAMGYAAVKAKLTALGLTA